MTFDLELTGRRALVTAGTKGVGAAVVEVLSENGAKVVTTARSIPRDSLASVHYIAADITTAAGCAHVAQGALNHLGGIDIVVNVLGGSQAPAGGFAALDDHEWGKEIDLNLMPAVRLDRALLPSMLARSGRGTCRASRRRCRDRLRRRQTDHHAVARWHPARTSREAAGGGRAHRVRGIAESGSRHRNRVRDRRRNGPTA